MLALAAQDIRLHGHRGVERGHDAVRRMLALQTYGVAQHIHPLRYYARGTIVAVEALVELRWVDDGELADRAEGVGVFEARNGRVCSFSPQPDLASASRLAGWPPASRANEETPARTQLAELDLVDDRKDRP
jgi:hypothetical protein